MHDVDALKRANPIEDVAGQYTKLRRAGQHLVGLCPFHDEKTGSFHVDPSRGRWRCFGRCATGWRDVIDFVGRIRFSQTWNNRNAEQFKEVLDELARSVPLAARATPLPRKPPEPEPRVRKTNDIMMLLDRVAAIYTRDLWDYGAGENTPLAYLRRRGFADQVLRDNRIGYATGEAVVKLLDHLRVPREWARDAFLIDGQRADREFMRGRITFPEIDEQGRVVHLIGRARDPRLGPKSIKYLSLKGFDKPLYGYARLSKLPTDRPVFVLESPPDILSLWQWGLDAIATLGTYLAPAQRSLLRALPRPVVYIPQSDGGTGLEAVERWQSEVGAGSILELPQLQGLVKDVNELARVPGGRGAFMTAAFKLAEVT